MIFKNTIVAEFSLSLYFSKFVQKMEKNLK